MSTTSGSRPFFRGWDEICDWEKQIAYCEIVDLSERERERAKQGVRYIRDIFGPDFLREAFETGHPLTHTVANLAPWTRQWIGWLAETIRSVEDGRSREDLIRRLRRADLYEEALSVLKVAHQFKEAGFQFEVDPLVAIGESEKKPDLLITDMPTGQRLYVEVTESKPSEDASQADRTLKVVWERLRRKGSIVFFCGAIHQILNEVDLTRIVEEVDRLIERVINEGKLQQIDDAVLEIAVVRCDDEESLRPWAEARSLASNRLIGPRYDERPITRILRKIRDKQKQLPPHTPSIVFIWNTLFLIQLDDVRGVIDQLSGRTEGYKQVLAVVVGGEWLGPGDEELRKLGEAVYVTKRRLDVMQIRILAVFNRACDLKVSSAMRQKIHRALGFDVEEAEGK